MALLSSSKKTEVIEKEGRALQLLVAESSIQIDDDQAHEIFLRSVIAIEFFEHVFNTIVWQAGESQHPEEVFLLIPMVQWEVLGEEGEERSADLGDGFEVFQVCQPREFLTDHELPFVFHPNEV